MKFIKLCIKCHKNGSETLAGLGIDNDEYEYRYCMINVDHIGIVYPNADGGTFITVMGTEIEVAETYERVFNLVSK